MTTRTVVTASYVLGVLGYGLGMVLSMLGQTPAGLLLLGTTTVVAVALFRSRDSKQDGWHSTGRP